MAQKLLANRPEETQRRYFCGGVCVGVKYFISFGCETVNV